jgi:hypothetical protein
MGGQACVFYGAAQFSKDINLLLLANAANYAGLHRTKRLGWTRLILLKTVTI